LKTIECRRCQEPKPPLEKAPFRSELGERILGEICIDCWGEWLEHQTLLINHYGLDPRDAKARQFLYEQVESVLLGEGDAEQVDTSKQGQIEWGPGGGSPGS
jgi:Fe-S cluster biosynthesis and repair protein YggX